MHSTDSLLDAISQVESGGNDKAVGKAGERSRYQIMRPLWKTYTKSTSYSDPVIAHTVAVKHLDWLRAQYRKARKFEASDFHLALMWKSGFAGFQKLDFNVGNFQRASIDRAQRIMNVLNQPKPQS